MPDSFLIDLCNYLYGLGELIYDFCNIGFLLHFEEITGTITGLLITTYKLRSSHFSYFFNCFTIAFILGLYYSLLAQFPLTTIQVKLGEKVVEKSLLNVKYKY